MTEVERLLKKDAFPRSAKYDINWMLNNQMGPNALWLVEWLAEAMDLKHGMRVLDLGCGKAMTSIYLAKELGLRVWAADLWIGPNNNWRRIIEAGVEDLVCPLHLEAHSLPFAQGFFDAVISIDAYTYFGTDSLYLSYICNYIRPGGQIGIVVPGLAKPLGETVPNHLTTPQKNGKVFWEDDCFCFKTPAFWAKLWGQSSKVKQVRTDILPEGWRHWADFEKALSLSGKEIFPSDAEALERDQGRYIALIRAIAARTEVTSENLYDSNLGTAVGVDTQ